jgi:hypothetical protein
MTDQELVLDALTKASLVISEYIEPGPRDAKKTLDALIFILQDEALAQAVARLEGNPPGAKKDESAEMRQRGVDPTNLGT